MNAPRRLRSRVFFAQGKKCCEEEKTEKQVVFSRVETNEEKMEIFTPFSFLVQSLFIRTHPPKSETNVSEIIK